jgi:hypothetical protein
MFEAMPTAKKSTNAKKSTEDQIHEARAEMLERSSMLSKNFSNIVHLFNKELAKLMAESEKISNIGHDLLSKLKDKWEAESDAEFDKAVKRYGEEEASEMSANGDIPSAEDIERKFAPFVDPLDDIESFDRDDTEGLAQVFSQLLSGMYRLTEKIRNVPPIR